MPNELKLLRETPWIKEWQTPWGPIIDSKFRWFAADLSPENFLSAWHNATPEEKSDLQSAFTFFPYELTEEINQILSTIALTDPTRATQMQTNLFQENSDLPEQFQRFATLLTAHTHATAIPQKLVGENQWFRALINEGGLHLDSKIESLFTMPTPAQLSLLQAEEKNIPYRRAITLVQQNPWLLEPAPGEQSLPGLTEI